MEWQAFISVGGYVHRRRNAATFVYGLRPVWKSKVEAKAIRLRIDIHIPRHASSDRPRRFVVSVAIAL